MSKLKELMQTLCPNGVEYKRLGEVCIMQRGSTITKQSITEGDIPVIAGGQKPAYYCDTYNRTGETITVAGSGAYAGYVAYWNNPIYVSDAFSVKGTEICATKYIYYALQNMQERIFSTKKGAGVPHVHIKSIEHFEIPVPPREVQEEIVRILDRFTELEAELEAELECRKRQYTHYRDSLLNFTPPPHEGSKVEYKQLGSIGSFYGGLSGKSKSDFNDGNNKFISYMNVYSNPSVDLNVDTFVKVSRGEKQNAIQYGDVLFTGSSETPDECGMSSVVTTKVEESIYLNSFCFGFRLNKVKTFEPLFLKHLLRSSDIRKQIVQTASGVTRFNVSKKRFGMVVIPIPPIEEQRRIVEILDKFEALTTDLCHGLPAEIEARRKQYEHYRDQLLTFKRLTA